MQAASGHRTRACVPHTPYTLVLKFVPSAGGVCGTATHVVGGNAGYGLLGPNTLEARLAKKKGRPVPQMPEATDIQVCKRKDKNGNIEDNESNDC